jgi:hypothetical protein
MKPLRLGAGAGYAGDRIEPALELVERGNLDAVIFECLAERTIALAQQARQRNPAAGFDPLLEARMRAVLPASRKNRVKVITNMGAANPVAAGETVQRIARELGLRGLKIAVVTGDDVLARIRGADLVLAELGRPVGALGDRIISANAYLGARPVVDALAAGADVVVTGRVGDAALFLAPLVHGFGWRWDDWDALGRGTLTGHLLECAGQVTGGYFADPGFKDVARLAELGFPIAEVAPDGGTVITKVAGSGGAVTLATCKEQLIYEIQDPAQYLQPDVIADFSAVTMREEGPDRVRVEGARGHPKTRQLKVSVGYLDSYVGEGQISYGGPGALARGRLALEIVRERLKSTGVKTTETRFDLIGVDSLYGDRPPQSGAEPAEVRVRVTARTESMAEAIRVGNEVETLYTNGPAGGGGATKSAREIVAVASTLIPETWVKPVVQILEA